MSESTTYTTPPPTSAEPARYWNYRSCPSTGCEWIRNLLPNDRCWNCHKLPVRPSDEPDVIGGKRGDVTVIHVHLRESLAEAERALAAAEKRTKEAEDNVGKTTTAWAEAADERDANSSQVVVLARQLEAARQVATSALDVLECGRLRTEGGEFIHTADVRQSWINSRRKELAAIDAPPANESSSITASDGSVMLDQICDFTFWAIVPPGFTKPMSRCINAKPCPIPGHSSEPPCPNCSQDAGGVAKLCAKHGESQPDGSDVAVPFGHIAAESPALDSAEPFSAEGARRAAVAVDGIVSLFKEGRERNTQIAATLRHYADLIDRIDRAVANLGGPEPHSRWKIIRILQGNEGGGE